MPYAIEMSFDAAAERVVRAVFVEMKRRGLGCDLTPSRPHVTLAVAEAVDEPAMRRTLAAFAAARQPVAVRLAYASTFPGGVVYLAPLVTPALLDLHRALHAAVPDLPPAAISHYYKPGAWTPHCTVAHDLRDDEIDLAARVALEAVSLPLDAALVRVSLVRFRPVDERFQVPLNAVPSREATDE
jgi:2'-5' RNA ligase